MSKHIGEGLNETGAATRLETDKSNDDAAIVKLAARGLTAISAKSREHERADIPEKRKSTFDDDEKLIPRFVYREEGEDGEVIEGEEFYDYGPAYDGYYGDEPVEREEYGNEARRYEVFPLPKEITERYQFIEKLPRNVAIMGGMARSIAREVITGDREPIRDIDLVNILDESGKSLNTEEELDRLAQEYMPDDYAFGHGIQDDELEHYFQTRDLTVNEALVMNGALVVSNFAYNDLQENIIRPTSYEQAFTGVRASSRLALRALMMQTMLNECTSSYPTIEDMRIDGDYLGSFDIAVQLNKAMSRGAATAQRFTDLLAEYGAIPSELTGKPKATAKYLLKYKLQRFEFRPNDDKRVSEGEDGAEAEQIDYHMGDSKLRAALREYKSDLRAERVNGHYTAAEYADINRQKYDYVVAKEEDYGYDYSDEDYEEEDYEEDYEDS